MSKWLSFLNFLFSMSSEMGKRERTRVLCKYRHVGLANMSVDVLSMSFLKTFLKVCVLGSYRGKHPLKMFTSVLSSQ